MLIELASVGVQRAEDADLDAQLARVPEQGAGGAAEQVIEQGPVIIEERPQQVRMVKVICCQSQSGRMCCCSAIHCSVPLRPQLLQALDLQV